MCHGYSPFLGVSAGELDVYSAIDTDIRTAVRVFIPAVSACDIAETFFFTFVLPHVLEAAQYNLPY
jgi:hypothetical protein